MNPKLTSSILIYLMVCALYVGKTKAQNFETTKISDKITLLTNISGGEDQLFITSNKGIIVINSFWSTITAEKFKKEFISISNRDDFVYTINMVDRLDMFGGNAIYQETDIIGHNEFIRKYKGKGKEVNDEIRQLINMWRWKQEVSQERLNKHKVGSKKAVNEEKWMNTCKQRADELENGFSLVLPNITYEDKLIISLGDITLKLIYFGKAGFNGMSILHIPEERTIIIPGFIIHSQHLAPHAQNSYADLDVERWIDVLEYLIEKNKNVDKVICDLNNKWTKERVITHLDYIRTLWNKVKEAESQGKSLKEIQEQFSLDTEFKFVKNMQVYKDHGDDWVRPQHKSHVKLFYLQHKNLASEIIKKEIQSSSVTDVLLKIKKLKETDDKLYVDEASINSLGYYFLNSEKKSDAIEIFKFNTKSFPNSINVYDSLGEAYMKNGQIKEAIINYEKVLELDPKNMNAKEMLSKMKK